MNKGFSLTEIAVVMLLVALLMAGITSGGNLLRQAELRKVIAEMDKMELAFSTYILSFKAIPGDDPNASNYFGTDCADTASFCNGNGDENITPTFQSNNISEIEKAYMHVRLAELVEGPATPLPDMHTGGTVGYTTKSEIKQGRYIYGGKNTNLATTGAVATFFPDNFGVYLGSYVAAGATYEGGAMRGLDAFSIDKKIDNGGLNGSGASSGDFQAVTGNGSATCATGDNYDVQQKNQTACVIGRAIR